MIGDVSIKLGDGKKLEAHATNEVVETVGITVAKFNEGFQIEQVKNITQEYAECCNRLNQ